MTDQEIVLEAIRQDREVKDPAFYARMNYNVYSVAIKAVEISRKQTLEAACKWLRDCIDVDDEVKMNDGEPEASSWIAKQKHRCEVADRIVADFRKTMKQK